MMGGQPKFLGYLDENFYGSFEFILVVCKTMRVNLFKFFYLIIFDLIKQCFLLVIRLLTYFIEVYQ